MKRFAFACCFAASAASAAPLSSLPTAELPACNDGTVLHKIQSRFAQKEGQFWASSREIIAFEQVRSLSGGYHDNNLPRKGCAATVVMDNQQKQTLTYTIIGGHGLLGTGWGVEWCVAGYDRGWAYNPACVRAKP